MARVARAWKTLASRRLRIALGLGILLVAVAAGGLDVARSWYTPDTAAVAVPISTTPSAAPTTAALPTVAFVAGPTSGNTCPTLKRKSKKADKAADRCLLQAGHKAKRTTTPH
jgi:hypothetical protein